MTQFKRNVERLGNNRPEYSDLKKGRTSRLDANGVPEADPSQDARAGYINVRLDNGRSQVEIVIGPLMRPNYALLRDLPVDTGVNRAGVRVCIKPSDPNDQQIGVYGNALSSPAIETRVFGSQNFAPGMLHAWAQGGYGLNVYVEEFTYKDRVISGYLPVTVPTGAGTRYQGVVYYDYAADALGIAYGTASSFPAALFNQQTAAAIDIGAGERIRLGALLLENGQTDVSEDSTRFYDLRDWLTPADALSVGDFDRILTDHNGNVLSDHNGNVLIGH